MSLVIELFTSNSLRARAFRFLPFFMLALLVLEVLFTEKLGYKSRGPNNPPLDKFPVTLHRIAGINFLKNSQQTIKIIKKQQLLVSAKISESESVCLKTNILFKRKSRKKHYNHKKNEKKDEKKYGKHTTETFRSQNFRTECVTPSNLGPVHVNLTKIPLEQVDEKYPNIAWGGIYYPLNCRAKYKVAIIIPYRDRRSTLSLFLNHIHPFLMKQEIIEYGIFVVEQAGRNAFNRAKLMNVGVMESDNLHPNDWQCFIFHDVDLLPQNTKNIYSCAIWPRHMSSSVDVYQYQLKSENAFGGVISLTRKQFDAVNGFSNSFWGWGGEDNDMFNRLTFCDYRITRYKLDIARYTMIPHEKPVPNPKRYDLMQSKGKNYMNDGISNLSYKLIHICRNHLFTHILVDIDFV